MERIRLGFLSPALWAIGNYMDKYLLSRFFPSGNNLGILLIFSSIVGFFILPIIFIFHPGILAISHVHKIVIIISGMLYIVSLIPYLYAMHKEDASNVVPLFQMIPPISLILGYIFLGETLSSIQIIGFSIIFIASVMLSLDFSHKIKFKFRIFGLMFLSSLLVSLNFLLFKRVKIDTSFWTTAFWEYVGWGLIGIILLLIPGYAKSFTTLFKRSKLSIIGLNISNELINIIAKLIMNFVTLLTLLGLAHLMNGFQPFFMFIYGIILTLFFPKIIKENYSKTIIIQKILCFLCMLFGLYLL